MSIQADTETIIVDNANAESKVLHYLAGWCATATGLDVGTGHFEIGALLSLQNHWPKVGEIRLLMGDEVSLRTKREFDRALSEIVRELDVSLEEEKKKNDFLEGVDRVVEALRSGQIRCKVYRKEKFHAKVYIARSATIATHALVGSSNFTVPGLTQNVELNVRHADDEAVQLAAWFEKYWSEAEDVTAEILRVIDRHVKLYSPFEVYAKSLREFFRDRDMSDTKWEQEQSRVFRDLDKYQQDGYRNMVRIASDYGGAFLCDGVGLGKTFVGLMLIERLVVHENKNVLLLVPKGARESVWEPQIRERLRHIGRYAFNNLVLMNHTDLLRGGEVGEMVKELESRAHAIVVDEAHHFRNPGPRGETPIDLSLFTPEDRAGQIPGTGKVKPSRYRKLFEIAEGKSLFLLTATPINNELADLRHMIELFSRRREDYFGRSLGINSLRSHFIAMERELEGLAQRRGQGNTDVVTDLEQARQVLTHDPLFNALVVQRSRDYVKDSQVLSGASIASFPEREKPQVAEYSVKKTYGKLLDMVEKGFDKEKPLFSLAIYYPLNYLSEEEKAKVDKFAENRQKQVVGLIRTQFLKRFESSVKAFELSCERLLLKLLAFVTKYAKSPSEKRKLDIWKLDVSDLIGYVHEHQLELFGEDEEEASEDLVSEEMLEDVRELDPTIYDVSKMVDESLDDLNALTAFLKETQKFEPAHDDKLRALKHLLKSDPVLRQHKVLIFTEFTDTARYIRAQLEEAGIEGVSEVDGDTKGREMVIRRFAPYYNGSSSRSTPNEIRVLISTDVLSEGLNLQDATRMINYDLHWNPVRLMQRIGRVDRRLNPAIEQRLTTDHPEMTPLRGKIAYWNFLPPGELDRLLKLYQKVTRKTLRISRTLGIETGKLLRPDDDYEALRDFNAAYDGEKSAAEKMHLEYEQLLRDHPELAALLDGFPNRVFSGKTHPAPDARGVFFCFRIPGMAAQGRAPMFGTAVESGWSEAHGQTRWYLYDLVRGEIIEDPTRMVGLIRSAPETTRICREPRATLTETRAKVEKHIKNSILRSLQAPIGVNPVLKAWMELN